MAMSNETKLAIQARLRLGATPQDVSEEFDVKLPTVYAISKQVKKEMQSDTVQDLHQLPTEVITHIVEESKKQMPMPTPSGRNAMVEAMEAVSVGADGLKKLDMSFQTTMTNVLGRFDEALKNEELGLKDVKLISDTVASAYEKVFSSGTNIHIGDNNDNSQRLTMFKNKNGV